MSIGYSESLHREPADAPGDLGVAGFGPGRDATLRLPSLRDAGSRFSVSNETVFRGQYSLRRFRFLSDLIRLKALKRSQSAAARAIVRADKRGNDRDRWLAGEWVVRALAVFLANGGPTWAQLRREATLTAR